MLENTKVQNQTLKTCGIIEQMKIYINLQYNQNTKTNYKYALKNFNKYIETQQIKEIQLNKNVIETILKSYKKYLINSNYSNKTIIRFRNSHVQLHKWSGWIYILQGNKL